MTVRVSLLTIESDGDDPAIMAALRELLERAGVNGAVVVSTPAAGPVPAAAAPTAPASKHTSIARHLMDGSLQELIMEAVTARPGTTDHELAAAILNDTTPSAVARIRLAASPLVLTGRLVRDGQKIYTPAAAATLPRFQGSKGKRKGVVAEPEPVAGTQTSTPPQQAERPHCPSFPPCRNCRDGGGACLSLVKPAAPVIDGEFREVDEEPPAPTPAVEAMPLRVQVGPGENGPVADPFGRVAGVEAPVVLAGSDSEKIVTLVHARPGITVDDLAREICGVCNGGTKRRIDMLVGPLTMSNTIVRFNGRLYKDTKTAGALKLPPPQRGGFNAGGTGQATPRKGEDPKPYYDKIVAAFAEDNGCTMAALAIELFGDSSGKSYQKAQIMVRQLVASERIEELGGGQYRPIDADERRGRADEEDEPDDDDTESSGVSDEDPEELELQ